MNYLLLANLVPRYCDHARGADAQSSFLHGDLRTKVEWEDRRRAGRVASAASCGVHMCLAWQYFLANDLILPKPGTLGFQYQGRFVFFFFYWLFLCFFFSVAHRYWSFFSFFSPAVRSFLARSSQYSPNFLSALARDTNVEVQLWLSNFWSVGGTPPKWN